MLASTILCYSVPPAVERILCDLEPLLLFLQASRCANKPSTEVLLLQVCFWDDGCIIVRTVFFPRRGLMRLIFGVIVFGRQIHTMFAVCILIVFCHRGSAVVVFSGVAWTIVIAAFAMAGLRAAPLTSALGLLLGGVILRFLVAVGFVGGVHHVHVM